MSVLNKDKFALYMDYDKELSKLEQDAIEKILIKISDGYPLSYLINRHFFYDDEFYLDENVLIPRVETEGVIDKLLEYGDKIYLSKKQCVFVDAGGGSGCVGISIAKKRPHWNIILLDKYETVISVLKENLRNMNISNINVICGDWLKSIKPNSIDFIFSNPPYVSFTDNLDDSVSNFEPHHALYSYDHGLDDIYKIILQSKEKLSNSGLLFIENGKGQSECICKELRSNDFTDIAVHLDYNGTEDLHLRGQILYE